MEHIAKISICGSDIQCTSNLFEMHSINFFIEASKCIVGTYMYNDRMWILSSTITGYTILIYSVDKLFKQNVMTLSSSRNVSGMKRNVSLTTFDDETIKNTEYNKKIPAHEETYFEQCEKYHFEEDEFYSLKDAAACVIQFVSNCVVSYLGKK